MILQIKFVDVTAVHSQSSICDGIDIKKFKIFIDKGIL